MPVYRTKFERINFCFDPPVKQFSDVVFVCDAPNDDDNWGKLSEAAWSAMWDQNPHWRSESKPFPIPGYGGWSSVLGGHKFEEVMDKDLDFDLGTPGDTPIPRIAEIFKEKGDKDLDMRGEPRKYRVDGFYKLYKEPEKSVSMSEQDRMMYDMVTEILAEEYAKLSDKEREIKSKEIKIIQCTREEAEFVSGVEVAGTIRRIEDVEVIGLVKWDARTIARARRDYKIHRPDWPTKIYKYWED